MMELLAQTLPIEPTGWIGLVIQGGIGGLALVMLRWFMGKNDTALKEFKEALDRTTKERAESNAQFIREVSESNTRIAKSNVLLVLAIHQADVALKAQAQEMKDEIENEASHKWREKEK